MGVGTTDIFGFPKAVNRLDAQVVAENRADFQREAILRGQIVDRDLTAPPASAADGAVYIPAATATGPWVGQEEKMAIRDRLEDGGWTFVALWPGARFWIVDEAVAEQWNGSAWESAAGGTTGLADGTAGAPSISPASDATSGIFFASGQVSHSLGGDEKIRVTASGIRFQFNGVAGDPSDAIHFAAPGVANAMRLSGSNGRAAFGTSPAAAQVYVQQTSSTAAIPVMVVRQLDVDQALINWMGTSAASAANTISTWTAGNSIQGFMRVEVNGTTYWMPYYDAPTS